MTYKNKPIKNKILLLILAPALVLLLSYLLPLKPTLTTPDVSFKTLKNETLDLKALKGKAVLITFWASNCPNCIKEIADFKHLYQAYQPRGLEIIAIAMSYDRPNYVVNTRQQYQIPYPIVLDLKGDLAKAFGGVSLIPTTFLINPQGDIAFQTLGTFDYDAMQARIEAMLPIEM
ncbi:MAG: redoxin domain-containing protein [Methyloprofundus sp.]|nr:redoxin domain-containing protein [Methyloprofundus sp.]